MASFGQFGQSMNRRADRLDRLVNAVVKEVASVVVSEVVRGTPVDTGEARSNWLVSLGGPLKGTIAPYAPGRYLGIGETANASAAIQRAAGAIAARQPGQDLVIQNNVPYIGRLNNGYSAQAPASFVQLALRRGILSLQGRELGL